MVIKRELESERQKHIEEDIREQKKQFSMEKYHNCVTCPRFSSNAIVSFVHVKTFL